MSTYQEKLYWHIRRLTHVHEDADDVLQNTLIKVIRSIDRFEGKAKLYTWLYRIATNESLTFLKRRKSRSSTGDDMGLAERLAADPYWDGDKAELVLQEALTILPEKQKAVFLLRYYEEMPYREMSEVLQTSEGSLKASYHHAAKKIEAFVKSQGL